MILEAGIAKLLAAGGGLVGSVALMTGMAGGAQYSSTVTSKPDIAAAVCAYDRPSAPHGHRSAPRLGLNTKQLKNAQIIVDTADKLSLPERAKIVGLAAALQESWLDENAVGDSGRARGLFQMWPSYGWGTVEQVTDPDYAARKFYSVLVKVKNWEKLPVTKAAQAVERSAYPNAYAKHEPMANAIVASLSSTPEPSVPRLSSAEAEDLSKNIEAAASMRVPRGQLVDHVTRSLADAESDRDDLIRQAENLVNALAKKLCAKLSTTLDKVTETVKDVTGRAAAAVKAAMAQRNVPYSWGGGGPNGKSYGIGRGATTKGFDCSGLTEYAWAKAGVRIGTVTYEQVKAGPRVPRSQVRPGDLVFYETSSSHPGPDHVGLAINGKEMVNAPYTGAVVRVDKIDRSGYAGAVRPV